MFVQWSQEENIGEPISIKVVTNISKTAAVFVFLGLADDLSRFLEQRPKADSLPPNNSDGYKQSIFSILKDSLSFVNISKLPNKEEWFIVHPIV